MKRKAFKNTCKFRWHDTTATHNNKCTDESKRARSWQRTRRKTTISKKFPLLIRVLCVSVGKSTISTVLPLHCVPLRGEEEGVGEIYRHWVIPSTVENPAKEEKKQDSVLYFLPQCMKCMQCYEELVKTIIRKTFWFLSQKCGRRDLTYENFLNQSCNISWLQERFQFSRKNEIWAFFVTSRLRRSLSLQKNE